MGASSSRPVIARVNGSLPARPNLSCQRNSILREPSTVVAGLVDRGARRAFAAGRRPAPTAQLAAGRRGERRAAALHQRDRSAAHVLPDPARAARGTRAASPSATTEVSSGRSVGSMRTCREASPILIVQPAGLDLRRAARTHSGRRSSRAATGVLAAELGRSPCCGLPDGLLAEPGRRPRTARRARRPDRSGKCSSAVNV